MKKTAFISIISFLVLFPVCSCSYLNSRPQAVYDAPSDSCLKDASMANRFSDNAYEKTSAVESAIELSEKYAALSNEAAELKQKNKLLNGENEQLKRKIDELNKQLLQTKKELTESNDLLINMRVELNNWKSNVLGFRDEMRQADAEQVKALIKILELLGGEVKSDTATQEHPAERSNEDNKS